MIQLRSFVFNVLTYASFLVMGVLGLPLLASPRSTLWLARAWSRVNLWLLENIAGLTVEIRGRERIPEGGCIIAAKHQSALETFAMVPVLPRFTFILKRELNWVPLFGWYTWRAGMIPVNRTAKTRALREIAASAKRAVARARQVIIFPEGTRRPPGAEPDYKLGVVHLYAECGVPCVPVALNTGMFWPRRRLLRHPGTAVIEFLEPIPPGLSNREFRARLEATVESASARLLAEARGRGEGVLPEPVEPSTGVAGQDSL